MIYFVQDPQGGPVKIGVTNDIKRRLISLRSAYGRPLVLLCTMEGGLVREREIHTQFKHLRIEDTEQFQPGNDLMDFIGHPRTRDNQSVDAMKGTQANGRIHALQIRIDERDQENIDRLKAMYGIDKASTITKMCWKLVADAGPPTMIDPEKSENPIW